MVAYITDQIAATTLHDANFVASALALEGQPKSAAYIREHSPRIDVCCHGWRWWTQHNLPEEEEREHIRLAVESLKKTVGITDTKYLGWYGRYAPR
jgi:allantoinase